MNDKIKDRRRFKTMLNSEDKKEMNELIVNELTKNGIAADEIPLMSPASMILAGFNTLFDSVSSAIQYVSRESNLIHAEYPSSLFNQLAQHTNEVVIARPSKIWLFVRVPVEDIKRYGKHVQDNTWQIEFDDINTCIIDNLIFMPVIPKFYVRVTFLPERKLYRVFYDYQGKKINVLVQNIFINGQETLGFKAEFKQVTIERFTKQFDDEQLAKFLITTEYPISDFDIYYRANSASNPVKINKRLFYTRGSGDYMEYKILGNNSIALIHKYVQGGFKPARGSFLEIVCYTTTGRDVEYKLAAARDTFTQATARVEYEPVGKRVYKSSGGSLAETSVEYLRNKVIQLRGARRRVDTESDLGTFLLNYEGESTFHPRLTHNDIASRIFSIYTVLSFGNSLNGIKRVFTIPTNTGNVNAKYSDMRHKQMEGFDYYSFNYMNIIKSTQSRRSDNFVLDKTIKPGKEPTVPEKLDPKDPLNNLYTYYYVAPFVVDYDKYNNMARVYMGAQYDETYLTFQTFEEYNASVPVRFVNTSVRVNDYLYYDRNKTSQHFSLNTEVRFESSNWEFKHGQTFQAYIELQAQDKTIHRIPCHTATDMGNNIWDLEFTLKTDKYVFNRWCEFSWVDDDTAHTVKTAMFNTRHKVKVICMIKEEGQPVSSYKSVSEFQGEIEFFKDVTKDMFTQTNQYSNDGVTFMSMPLVKSDFYIKSGNQKHITEEVKKIVTFLDHAVYDQLDEYSSRSNDVHDIQETNLRIAIKFAKTYGLSKFLDVGEVNKVLIHNLQMRPKLLIRKLDPEFDEAAIASELNQSLIKHDYYMEDLHMSSLVYSVLDKAGDAVSRIQFINFDNYPDNYHMIIRNDQTPNNLDPPEVVSLEPVYDEVSDTYKFNIKFTYI